MNVYKNIALASVLLTMAAACGNDGELIYTSGTENATLDGPTENIVLDKNNLDALALTLYWNENGEISLSNPNVSAPDGTVVNTVQFSATEGFDAPYEEIIPSGNYQHQWSCGELNNILTRLGFEGGVAHALYLRLKSSIGENVEPRYSNVVQVLATPYYIDMTIGFCLDENKNLTSRTLYSPEANGFYYGFIGASAWENWFFREGHGVEWGGAESMDQVFEITNAPTAWKIWFPEISGCYYTTVDVNKRQWSALLVDNLHVSGDIEGEMSFDRRGNTWNLVFAADGGGNVSITIEGNGRQFDVNSRMDVASSLPVAVGFGGEASGLSFGDKGTPVTVALPAAGESTLTIDLNDPRALSVYVTAGGKEEEVVPEQLYLSGITENWDFNSSIALYDRDNLKYGGVLRVNSEWGYRIFPEADNWDKCYSLSEGDASEGSLQEGQEPNIPAPATPGLYVFDVSLSGMTYKVMELKGVYTCGFNDNWDMIELLPDAGNQGVYSVDIDILNASEWGFQILLNDDWAYKLGGADGVLSFQGGNITDDAALSPGVYTLVVDVLNYTYALTLKQ